MKKKDIKLLMLEADTQSESAVPFTTFDMGRCTFPDRIPITVVSGN